MLVSQIGPFAAEAVGHLERHGWQVASVTPYLVEPGGPLPHGYRAQLVIAGGPPIGIAHLARWRWERGALRGALLDVEPPAFGTDPQAWINNREGVAPRYRWRGAPIDLVIVDPPLVRLVIAALGSPWQRYLPTMV